jgi:hypothetical protein
MGFLEARLRNLERVSTDRTPFIVILPYGPPTLEMQLAMDAARQAGRVVVLLRPDDVDL